MTRRYLLLVSTLAGCQRSVPLETGGARKVAPAASPLPAEGPLVMIVEFGSDGRSGSPVSAAKVVLSAEQWRARLTAAAFSVLREKGTELAFTGQYAKSTGHGLYRCAGCGTVLFRSEAKFESGTGWPSFFEPAAAENVYTERDESLGIARDEVLCRRCDGHLGHVFPDGPEPTGLRYCMNSAALEFVPLSAR